MTSTAALVSKIEHTIRTQHLFQPGDTLIVAFSGGADSTALLDLLCRLPHYNLRLIAAHLNHCLRGAESDADQEFCREVASRYAILFESKRVDVKAMAVDGRLNLEDAGRQARIEFLDDTRRKYNASSVVLAHHADDQAETVLMRLLRGSGLTGLSGMAYLNTRGYVRPLLETSRLEIERYLQAQGLQWREDASNIDTTYLRNRIRHELLPFLEKYNPAIRSCLASTASIISGDEELLGELTEQAFAQVCLVGEGEVVCKLGAFSAFSLPLRRRVLREALKKLAGTLAGIGQRHVDALCEMITSPRPNSQLNLPHSIMATREYDRLLLMVTSETSIQCSSANASGSNSELLIHEPGRYQLPTGGSLLVEATSSEAFLTDSNSVFLDLEKAPFPWILRTFRPGDRMKPFGMSGNKKVKDIFIDRKVPVSQRKNIPLLWCEGELLWVAGVCASELCRLERPFGAVVRITLQP